jgi:hypothetical protein
VPILANSVVDSAVTDQLVGADTSSAACLIVVRPLLVSFSTAVNGVPGVASAGTPDRPRVTLGATVPLGRPFDTRYITVPCAGTVALILPAVSESVCVHRSRTP